MRLVLLLSFLLVPAPSSAVAATLKAVQSGTATIPAATLSTSVTLTTAVAPARSFLVFGVAEAENEPQRGRSSAGSRAPPRSPSSATTRPAPW
jgi:hypothetical protein